MNLKNKNVFVTGSSGFIGSHLVERLVQEQANVTCFVKYNSKNSWGNLELLPKDFLSSLKIIPGDVRDIHILHKSLKDIDIVFHLAALIGIPYSYTNPRENFQTNVLGTLNILTAAQENNIQKFIHTSSSEVYGTPETLPISEFHPLKGQSPYSASKVGADKVVESFHYAYDFPSLILRPFNTYGPRQSARAVIPTIITQALTKDTLNLGNLNTTRDFLYVADTVNGFIKAAESKLTGKTIQIGTGKETSIQELVKKISKILNKEIKVNIENNRIRPNKSEVLRLCADASKAKQLLDWQPSISIDEGLERTISWIKENINNYKTNIYNI